MVTYPKQGIWLRFNPGGNYWPIGSQKIATAAATETAEYYREKRSRPCGAWAGLNIYINDMQNHIRSILWIKIEEIPHPWGCPQRISTFLGGMNAHEHQPSTRTDCSHNITSNQTGCHLIRVKWVSDTCNPTARVFLLWIVHEFNRIHDWQWQADTDRVVDYLIYRGVQWINKKKL